MRIKRKLLSVLLTVAMLVTLVPAFAFADEGAADAEIIAAEGAAVAEESTPAAKAPAQAAGTPVADVIIEEGCEKTDSVVETVNNKGNDIETGGDKKEEQPTAQGDQPAAQGGQPAAQAEDPCAADKPEDPAMPAQTFTGGAGNIGVTASAGSGVFPADTSMKVTSVSWSYFVSAADAATGAELDVVDGEAVDITFFDQDGKEIQPAAGSVSVSLSSRTIAGDTHAAVHITDGGKAEIIGGASEDAASFKADHFSIYGIIGGNYESGAKEYARYTYIFKVMGEEVARQIVRDGDMLTEPPAPADADFKGWRVEGAGADLDFTQSVSIPDTETQDRDIIVNAVFPEMFYATFYMDTNKGQILRVKSGEAGETVTTSDVSFLFDDGTAIVGWMDEGGNEITSFTFSDSSVDLIPVIANAVTQVTFVTGEGSPVNPVFVATGKQVARPADPVRSGYTFTGWYSDKECTELFDFESKIYSSTFIYAGWAGETTSYRVVHWKMNVDGETYTAAATETMSGNAGQAAAWTAKNYAGFSVNNGKSSEAVVIKGDGTSIKNVYYDRNSYWLRFYEGNDLLEQKQFLYGADTSAYWFEVSEMYPNFRWCTEKGGNVAYTYAPLMVPANGNMEGFTGITVYGERENSGVSYIYYQDVDTKEQIRERYVLSGGKVFWILGNGWSFTPEDYVGIPGYHFVRSSGPNYEGGFAGIGSQYVGRVYYAKDLYTLTLLPQASPDDSVIKHENVQFKEQLGKYEPAAYKAGQTTRVINGITKTFAGWYDNQACQGEPFDFNTTMQALDSNGDEMTLYGKWTSEMHTVSFDLNGGRYDGANSITAQEVESGTQAEAPDSSKMERAGFVFGGWESNGQLFSFDARITGDITLRARWNIDSANMLRVEYDAGEDGVFTLTDSRAYQNGSAAVIKGRPGNVTRGKYFVGWKIGTSDEIAVEGAFEVREDISVDGVILLTAQYADVPGYATNVIYDAGRGTIRGASSYEDKGAVVNGTYKIIADEALLDGWDFAGWSTQENAAAAMFKSGQNVAAGKDSENILYAVYEAPVYTIVEGDGQSWTRKSSNTARFVVKSSANDHKTFGRFAGVSVDGKDVAGSAYTTGEGSLILELKPDYLESLGDGNHDISIRFKGGFAAKGTFEIAKGLSDDPPGGDEDDPTDPNGKKPAAQKDAKGKNVTGKGATPKTGDGNNAALWLSLMGVSIVCILSAKRKKESK